MKKYFKIVTAVLITCGFFYWIWDATRYKEERNLIVNTVSVIDTPYNYEGEAKAEVYKLNALDQRIVDTIWNIPEVIAKDKEIRRLSNNKRDLTPLVQGYPDKENPYFYVQVSEWNGDVCVPYYHFYVDPETFKVYITDSETGKLLCLQDFRIKYKRTIQSFEL